MITFSFAVVNNITTIKFANKVEAKIEANIVLEFKQTTESIFRVKNNFYIALWSYLVNRFVQTCSQIHITFSKKWKNN